MERIKKTLYKFIKWLVWLFYPKITVEGVENLPQEPALIVGNHSKMNGPIAAELYFPGDHYTWCAGQMMHLKDVPDYAYQDFWSEKPRYLRRFFRALSYIIAPLSVCVFTCANTIGVYRDSRVISTFKNTVKRLSEGNNVIIFPECAQGYNNIINEFQDKFIDVARLYYKKTGKEVCFVPMYLAPNLRKMYLGKPISFRSAAPMDEERARICQYLMAQITEIAVNLPEHTVVPYNNIPKKNYPTNRSVKQSHEDTRC